jgi:hypothetical protein
MKTNLLLGALCAGAACVGGAAEPARPFTVVGTGQPKCYDNAREIAPPQPGQPFYGQDAQHPGPQPAYKDNGDGTISDLNTGLTWVKARGTKVTWDAAVAGAKSCKVGGFGDWRMPTIKELYSLINFTGAYNFQTGPTGSRPYLDTKYFEFVFGDESKGVRGIDCQDWTATEYISTTMHNNPTVFGVNFADGRIKGYPKNVQRPGPQGASRVAHTLLVRYVRGNPAYGKNDFHDNGNETLTDRATGLMWQQHDSGKGLNWEQALAYAAGLNLAGHSDWRLPNAKELQSIADYSRIPASAPLFQITKLSDGEYPFFWSSTTHLDGPPDRQGGAAIYVAFGRALGWMQPRGGGGGTAGEGPGLGGSRAGGPGRGRPTSGGSGNVQLLDVHGAGAQRSDPKVGDPQDYPHGRGPQGDVIRIFNFVRCVRTAAP